MFILIFIFLSPILQSMPINVAIIDSDYQCISDVQSTKEELVSEVSLDSLNFNFNYNMAKFEETGFDFLIPINKSNSKKNFHGTEMAQLIISGTKNTKILPVTAAIYTSDKDKNHFSTFEKLDINDDPLIKSLKFVTSQADVKIVNLSMQLSVPDYTPLKNEKDFDKYLFRLTEYKEAIGQIIKKHPDIFFIFAAGNAYTLSSLNHKKENISFLLPASACIQNNIKLKNCFIISSCDANHQELEIANFDPLYVDVCITRSRISKKDVQYIYDRDVLWTSYATASFSNIVARLLENDDFYSEIKENPFLFKDYLFLNHEGVSKVEKYKNVIYIDYDKFLNNLNEPIMLTKLLK